MILPIRYVGQYIKLNSIESTAIIQNSNCYSRLLEVNVTTVNKAFENRY